MHDVAPQNPGRRARLAALLLAGAATSALVVGGLAAPAQAEPSPTPTTATATVSEGDFVTYGGAVYRIAGGAPVVVDSWDGFGGARTTTALTDAEFDGLRTVPADGTFLVGVPRGEVYRVAGGAPVYVSTWDAFGGRQPTVAIDDAAIDHAGDTGTWSHLLAVPKNGTYVRGSTRMRTYVVQTGRLAATEAQSTGVVLDEAAITNAGTGGLWNHLLGVVPSNPVFAPLPVSPTPVLLTDPPATTTTVAVPVRVRVTRDGAAVRSGWLCLAKAKSSPVRGHATSVGSCAAVAATGATTVTPKRAGTYYLIHVGKNRTVSWKPYAVSGTKAITVTWRI